MILGVGEALMLEDAAATLAFGASFAALPAHGVLFLEGDLGSGKTTFTTGLARALEFAGEVSSPTYALIQVYPTPHGDVIHVDAYRVRHKAELYEMDLERLLDDARLSVVEWGQAYYEDFPGAVVVRLEYHAGGAGRRATRVR